MLWTGFQKPKRLEVERSTLTSHYGRFHAQPFERGFGTTIGNSLRRVLLSSLEGAAITSFKVDGAMHEFATIAGVVEDVTEIVLNLKRIKFKAHTREPQTLLLSVNKEGPVTAADIGLNQNVELVNPDQHICTLDKKKKFEMELEVQVGRGFCPGGVTLPRCMVISASAASNGSFSTGPNPPTNCTSQLRRSTRSIGRSLQLSTDAADRYTPVAFSRWMLTLPIALGPVVARCSGVATSRIWRFDTCTSSTSPGVSPQALGWMHSPAPMFV